MIWTLLLRGNTSNASRLHGRFEIQSNRSFVLSIATHRKSFGGIRYGSKWRSSSGMKAHSFSTKPDR